MANTFDFRLDNRVALVTGGSSGIGQAIALGLAVSGAAVGVVDRDGEGLAATVDAIHAAGGRAVSTVADVTVDGDIDHAIESIEAQLGPLELAVNSAGIADAAPALDLDVERFERLYKVNVTGVFRSCQAEARVMATRRRGSILNLASISGIVSHREMTQVHYNSAKAAVAHMSRSLATEWAPLGIRVNSLAPGFTLTPMNRREEVASLIDTISALIPLGRFAEAKEMVGPAVFLLSDAASYCTGVDLVVDGGYTVL